MNGDLSESQKEILFKVIKRRTLSYTIDMVKSMAPVFRREHSYINSKIKSLISTGNLSLSNFTIPLAESVENAIFNSSKDGYITSIDGDSVKGYMNFDVKASVEGGVAFTMDNEGIKEWLDEYTMVFADTMKISRQKTLGKIVKREIETGGGLESITERIQDQVNEKWKWLYGKKGTEYTTAWQARRIALTETGKAQNAGHLSGMIDSGVVKYKGWLSSRNKKVRNTHSIADSSYSRYKGIPLNENFGVGGATLSAPGMLIGGDVGEVVNCHCVVISSKRGKSRNGSTVCFPNNV